MESSEPAHVTDPGQLSVTASPKSTYTRLNTVHSVPIMTESRTSHSSDTPSIDTNNDNSTTANNNTSDSVAHTPSSSKHHSYTFRQSNHPELSATYLNMNDEAEQLNNTTELMHNNNSNFNQIGNPSQSTSTSNKQSQHQAKTVKYASDTLNDTDEWVTIQAQPSDIKFADEQVFVQVTKSDLVYNLKPIHCGRSVVFLNASDPNFYKRTLPNPSLYVWLLSNLKVEQSHALKRMFESGWRQNIQIKVMDTNNFELIASKDGLEGVLYNGERIDLPDAIFNRVGANAGYFAMAVIRQLENMGVLIFNNLRSIEISKDKMLTLQHLAAHGLPIPKTLLAKFPLNLDAIKREFTYPIILKKASGSQGKGIVKLESHAQLEDLVDMLDTVKPIIFQEFISASTGRDLRVFVVGGRVVGAMMRIAAKGQFKANVHQGGTVKPVKISPQVEWLVLETVKIIGLDIAGVDLLIDEKTYKICEVNSSPGFDGLEKALGENIAIKMFMYMKMRLGVWRRSGNKAGRSGISINVPVENDSTGISSSTAFDQHEYKQTRDEEASGVLPAGLSSSTNKAASRKLTNSRKQ